MVCVVEPSALSDAVTADLAADLSAAAEAAAAAPPVYVIGTEVPIPGGALDDADHLRPTAPEAVADTVEVHRRAFAGRGLEAAFARAIAVVVQPGVEFGNDTVAVYDPERARTLAAARSSIPQLVFE